MYSSLDMFPSRGAVIENLVDRSVGVDEKFSGGVDEKLENLEGRSLLRLLSRERFVEGRGAPSRLPGIAPTRQLQRTV